MTLMQMGMQLGSAGVYSRSRTRAAYRAASDKLARLRAMRLAGAELRNDFTQEERARMVDKDKEL
ncbi:MAG: hypothetical protein AAF627_13110 [Myxococcota bacterium]